MIQHVANLVISPLSTYLLHISLHSYQLALHSVSGELEPLTHSNVYVMLVVCRHAFT